MKTIGLILLLATASMAQDKPAQLTDGFRTASIKAFNAVSRRAYGATQREEESVNKAMDNADAERRSAADAKTFAYLKDFLLQSEFAKLDIEGSRTAALIRAQQGRAIGKTIPNTENVVLFEKCKQQLDTALHAGIVPQEFSCSKK